MAHFNRFHYNAAAVGAVQIIYDNFCWIERAKPKVKKKYEINHKLFLWNSKKNWKNNIFVINVNDKNAKVSNY